MGVRHVLHTAMLVFNAKLPGKFSLLIAINWDSHRGLNFPEVASHSIAISRPQEIRPCYKY